MCAFVTMWDCVPVPLLFLFISITSMQATLEGTPLSPEASVLTADTDKKSKKDKKDKKEKKDKKDKKRKAKVSSLH